MTATNRVTAILNRFAHFFGTSAEFRLNLQSLNEISLSQKKAGKSIRALPTLKRSEQEHASQAICRAYVRVA